MKWNDLNIYFDFREKEKYFIHNLDIMLQITFINRYNCESWDTAPGNMHLTQFFWGTIDPLSSLPSFVVHVWKNQY